VSPANALAFGTTLKFSYQIDPVDATTIHFRMDGATLDWISVMIAAGDYNTGDSMTAYTNAAGTWVLEDQTGHPNGPAMSDVGNNGRDDLLNKLVWLPTPTSVAATWSRKLNTGDAIADKIITNGTRGLHALGWLRTPYFLIFRALRLGWTYLLAFLSGGPDGLGGRPSGHHVHQVQHARRNRKICPSQLGQRRRRRASHHAADRCTDRRTDGGAAGWMHDGLAVHEWRNVRHGGDGVQVHRSGLSRTDVRSQVDKSGMHMLVAIYRNACFTCSL
jgi:hypothetical protein